MLGAILWNLLLDDALRLPYAVGMRVIAHTEKFTIVVDASSHARIEKLTEETRDISRKTSSVLKIFYKTNAHGPPRLAFL